MESRFVQGTTILLFAGVVTVQLLRLLNAWIRSAEAYTESLGQPNIMILPDGGADEPELDPDDLPEWN